MLTEKDSFAGQDIKTEQVTTVQKLHYQPLASTPVGFSASDRASESLLLQEATKKQLLRVSEKLNQLHTAQNMRFVVRFGNFSSSFRTKEGLESNYLISKFYAVNFMQKEQRENFDNNKTQFGLAFDSFCPFLDLKLKLLSELVIDRIWSSSSLAPKNDRKKEQASLKGKFNKNADRQEQIRHVLSKLHATEWRDFGTENFLTLATKSRVESSALQLYVDESELSAHFEDLVYRSRKALMADKLGCHVLRRVVLKSSALRSSVLATARLRLLEYSSCEHSSRVLQVLVRIDEPLRIECLDMLCRQWKFLAAHISAIYLYTVCLELTPNTHWIFTEFRKVFFSNLEFVLKSKNSKRLLVSYLEYCSEFDLALFCDALGFRTFFVKRMDDKYMVYIFSVFLAREYEEAVNILASSKKYTAAKCFQSPTKK